MSWSGACRDNVADGDGQLQWRQPGGTASYVGGMRAGLRHGLGKVEFGNGTRLEAHFASGRPVGPATITGKDGRVLAATARDGCVYLDGQFLMEVGRPREGCAARLATPSPSPAQQSPTSAASNRSPGNQPLSRTRCADIISRVQIGGRLTDDDRTFLQTACR